MVFDGGSECKLGIGRGCRGMEECKIMITTCKYK